MNLETGLIIETLIVVILKSRSRDMKGTIGRMVVDMVQHVVVTIVVVVVAMIETITVVVKVYWGNGYGRKSNSKAKHQYYRVYVRTKAMVEVHVTYVQTYAVDALW